MAVLDIISVSKLYGAVRAVNAVNLRVEHGEFVSFLGPSGCGKTTTLRMIAGLELPSAGSIVLDDVDITYRPPRQRNVGLVFQNYALFPNMTVSENISFGLRIARRPTTEIKSRVAEMLAIIKMESFGQRYPYQLSGGQQQRVALARALAIRPRILLLDEPLSALDAKIRVDLRADIRAIQQSLGITTVYVTHDQEEALSLSDRIVVMHDGEVEQIGTPSQVYNRPATPFVASFVGTLNRLNADVVDANEKRLMIDGQMIRVDFPMERGWVGQSVVVGLRPESLEVTDERPADARLDKLAGRVTAVSFLGSIVRVSLTLGGNAVAVDVFNQPRATVPGVNDNLVVAFPTESVFLISAPGQ